MLLLALWPLLCLGFWKSAQSIGWLRFRADCIPLHDPDLAAAGKMSTMYELPVVVPDTFSHMDTDVKMYKLPPIQGNTDDIPKVNKHTVLQEHN